MSFNIAIDGPAGAGKSTIAKKLAAMLGYIYVDTGAMYRAMALFLSESGIDLSDETQVGETCEGADITLTYEEGTQVVLLNGRNVNGLIRTEEVGKAASLTSKVPRVRERLTRLQQELAARENVVMDGRDIGTVVLPNADVKVFLTASSAERARRRYEELLQKGETPVLEQIEADIIARDEQDMKREIAPLVQAKDAVLIDSSDMDIDQVIERIKGLM